MPKKEGSHVIFCNTVVKSPELKTKCSQAFFVKTVDICRKIKSFFPLFPQSMLLII